MMREEMSDELIRTIKKYLAYHSFYYRPLTHQIRFLTLMNTTLNKGDYDGFSTP